MPRNRAEYEDEIIDFPQPKPKPIISDGCRQSVTQIIVALIALIGVLAGVFFQAPSPVTRDSVPFWIALIQSIRFSESDTSIVIQDSVAATLTQLYTTESTLQTPQTIIDPPFATPTEAIVSTASATITPPLEVTATPQSIIPTNTLVMATTAAMENLTSGCPPDAIFTEALSFDNQTYNRGTGVFSRVGIPVGNLSSEYSFARDAFTVYNCIQILSPGTLLDGQSNRQCRISSYNTNRIWAGAIVAGVSLEVQRANSSSAEVIGVMNQIPNDARNYMLEYSLNVGDTLCLVAPNGMTMQDIVERGGYHVMFGRDLMHFANSWCVLRENDGSSHYCINYGG